jgi:hypothetical protein
MTDKEKEGKEATELIEDDDDFEEFDRDGAVHYVATDELQTSKRMQKRIGSTGWTTGTTRTSQTSFPSSSEPS